MRARTYSHSQTHTGHFTHASLSHVVALVVAARALAFWRKTLVAVWHICRAIWLLCGIVRAVEEVSASPAWALEFEP